MRLRRALPLLLTLGLAAASCQVAPTTGPRATGVPAQAPAQAAPKANDLSVRTGRVVVDRATLQAWLKPQGRKLLVTAANEPAIARIRLTAIGPGIPVAETTEQDFVATEGSPGVQPPPSDLTLAVTPGQNRVFFLEALDEEGQVVKTMRTLGAVSPGGGQTLTIDAGTDAAARVLEDLLTPELREAGAGTDLIASLGTTDVTGDLKAFVLNATGFNATSNTYSLVEPLYFRDRELAKQLLQANSTAMLKVAPAPAFQNGAGARAGIQVTVTDLGELAQGVALTIYAPGVTDVTTTAVGAGVFSNVPPGRWVVKATRGAKTNWTTIRAVDNEDPGYFFMELDPQRTGPELPPATPLPGDIVAPPLVTPVATSTPFPSATPLPYAVTFAGRNPVQGTINGLGRVPGNFHELDKVALDGAGKIYTLQYGLVLKNATDANTYEVLFKAGTDELAGAFDIVAMAVGLDGVVFAADNQGRIFSRDLAGTVTQIGTQAGVVDLAVVPGQPYLFVRHFIPPSAAGLTKFDLAQSTTLNYPLIPGQGPIAADGDGNVYGYNSLNNEIWLVPSGGLSGAMRFTGSGRAGVDDGNSGTEAAGASFVKPAGLSVDTANNVIYVADAGANRIRAIDGTTGTVTTAAGGSVGLLDAADGLGAERFNRPASVAVRPGGVAGGNVNLMIADTGNARLRVYSQDAGAVFEANAFGQPGLLAGNGPGALFGDLYGLAAVDGQLLVADDSNNVIWTVGDEREASPLIGTGAAYDDSRVGFTGVATSLIVDKARLEANPVRDRIFVKRNQSSPSLTFGTRLFDGSLYGAIPPFAFGNYAFDAGKAFGLDATGSTFTIHEIPLSGDPFARLSEVPTADANAIQVLGAKAYVAFGGGSPHIDEFSLTGPPNQRTVYNGGVFDFAVDAQNGHLYAIAQSGCEVLDINPVGPSASVLMGQTGSYGVIDGPKATARFEQLRAIAVKHAGGSHYVFVTDGHTIRRIQRP